MTDFDIRFGGIQRLYGRAAFKTLQSSHVCVVGLGGVGSWTVEALARSGVGSLTLVDFDDICVSNTNRQLHAMQGEVGKLKVDSLSARVAKINPDLKVKKFNEAYSKDTESLLFDQKFDLVVDAIDHGLSKQHLILACFERMIPIVVSGSAGGRFDMSQIKMGDLSQSKEDPMLASLRKNLRQKHAFPRKGSMRIDCVYSMEKPTYTDEEGHPTQSRPSEFKKPLDCRTGFGTVTHITGSFGFALAHLAISRLLKDQ